MRTRKFASEIYWPLGSGQTNIVLKIISTFYDDHPGSSISQGDLFIDKTKDASYLAQFTLKI